MKTNKDASFIDYFLFIFFVILPFIIDFFYTSATTISLVVSWIIAIYFGSKETGGGHHFYYRGVSGYKKHTVFYVVLRNYVFIVILVGIFVLLYKKFM